MVERNRLGSCPSRTLFHPAFLRLLPSAYLTLPFPFSFSSSLSLSFSPIQTGHSSLSGFPWGSHTRNAHAAAYVHLTCTCTHADPAFRVLASPDKSRRRLHVGDTEGWRKREKGRESERERERKRGCERGCWSEGVGCIVEAHALELDEHLSLHIRAFLSSFRSHPALSFHFSVFLFPRCYIPTTLFHPFHLFRWPFISKGSWANANFLVKWRPSRRITSRVGAAASPARNGGRRVITGDVSPGNGHGSAAGCIFNVVVSSKSTSEIQ